MRPKTKLAPDTIALRQMLTTAVVSFVVGFVAICIGVLWLQHASSQQRFWNWGLAIRALQSFHLAFLGGLALAAACCVLLSRWHYRKGFHRCVYCGRVLAGIETPCSCPEIQAIRREAEAEAKRSVA